MSDEEDYDSEEDADYVPSDGEAVSEEEHSGDDENLDALREDGETLVTGIRRKKSPKKKSQQLDRKRKGGIQLEGEAIRDAPTEDKNHELAAQIRVEQIQKKEDNLKKRSNDLWSSFLSDVGTRPDKKAPASTTAPSASKPTTSQAISPGATQPEAASTSALSSGANKSTITVTKVFDFAGESVEVTKKLDVNSKEGQAELKKQQGTSSGDTDTAKKAAAGGLGSGLKRPGGGLGGVLEKINKKPKIGTLLEK